MKKHQTGAFNTYTLPTKAALFFHRSNQIEPWKEDFSLDQARLYSPHYEIDK